MPGIEPTNDPLMQARLLLLSIPRSPASAGPISLSYPSIGHTARSTTCSATACIKPQSSTGVAPYHPNSIDGDEPPLADETHGGYVQTSRVIEGTAVRAQPSSFDDHFSQATMFYRSLSPIEQTHVVEAFTFELGKVYEQSIKERELQVLANVDTDLCEQVAAGLGLSAPKGKPAQGVIVSPALVQMLTEPGPIDGRKVGIIADAGSDLGGVSQVGESHSGTWCYRIR